MNRYVIHIYIVKYATYPRTSTTIVRLLGSANVRMDSWIRFEIPESAESRGSTDLPENL